MPAIRQTTKPGATKPGAIGNERVLVVISARVVCVGKSAISRNFAGGVAGRAASVYLGFAAPDPHGRLFIRITHSPILRQRARLRQVRRDALPERLSLDLAPRRA